MTFLYKLHIITILLLFPFLGYSQIGILTENPHSSAVLDINSQDKGVLLPRLTSQQKESIVNPAEGLFLYDTDRESLSLNIGSSSVPKWAELGSDKKSFFYMPSINIPTDSIGVVRTIDLYGEYKKQFATPQMSGIGAPVEIPYFPEASDLFYYITYHNPNQIDISKISADGKMTYKMLRKANYDAYINIIFMIK